MIILGRLENTQIKRTVQLFHLYQFDLNFWNYRSAYSVEYQLSANIKVMINGQILISLKVVQLAGCFMFTTLWYTTPAHFSHPALVISKLLTVSVEKLEMSFQTIYFQLYYFQLDIFGRYNLKISLLKTIKEEAISVIILFLAQHNQEHCTIITRKMTDMCFSNSLPEQWEIAQVTQQQIGPFLLGWAHIEVWDGRKKGNILFPIRQQSASKFHLEA